MPDDEDPFEKLTPRQKVIEILADGIMDAILSGRLRYRDAREPPRPPRDKPESMSIIVDASAPTPDRCGFRTIVNTHFAAS
jgi:hypothetical protein